MPIPERSSPFSLHIATMCLLATLPLMLLASYLLVEVAAAERARLEDQTRDQARELARLIEAEMKSTVAMLDALATDPGLQSGDLGAFHRRASLLNAENGVYITLRDAPGRMLLNTRVPWGSEIPVNTATPETHAAVLGGNSPLVSNLYVGAILKVPMAAVSIPLRTQSGTYVLSATIPASRLQRLIADIRYSPGRWGVVFDREGTIVARSVAPERTVGKKAVPPALEAIQARRSSARLTSPEGIRHYAAFEWLPLSGWSASVAVSEATLLAPMQRTMRWLAALAGLATAVSAALAFIYGRFIARDITALTRAAVSLGRGACPSPLTSSVREVRVAGMALTAAHDAVKARELDLQKAKSAAEAVNTSKASFLSAISHDLRQPFQALRLFQSVLEEQAGPELHRVVSSMGQALSSGEELLAALVELAVIDAGKVEVTISAFPLDGLLSEIIDECAPMAEAAALALRYVPTSAWVHTDRTKLRRILRNLLVNAIRYTPRGRVLVGCRRRHGKLQVVVADTGTGIPDDKLERIFDEFFQIGNPSRDRGQGLGLGLTIVSRFCALLGHTVTVRSVEGKGSTFAVELKLSCRSPRLCSAAQTSIVDMP